MFYSQLLDTIRCRAKRNGLKLEGNIADILTDYIHDLAEPCPKAIIKANNWIEDNLPTEVFKAYTTIQLSEGLELIDMREMFEVGTYHSELISIILNMPLTNQLYYTVCRDWGAFSLNPAEFQDTVVVSLVKQALLEKHNDAWEKWNYRICKWLFE